MVLVRDEGLVPTIQRSDPGQVAVGNSEEVSNIQRVANLLPYEYIKRSSFGISPPNDLAQDPTPDEYVIGIGRAWWENRSKVVSRIICSTTVLLYYI